MLTRGRFLARLRNCWIRLTYGVGQHHTDLGQDHPHAGRGLGAKLGPDPKCGRQNTDHQSGMFVIGFTRPMPSFGASDIATLADGAQSVYVADMDGDGDLDVVSASYIDDTVAWYENDGAANPSWTAADIATSADGASSVYVADMDGDGDLDIVSSSQNDDTIAWYENDGAADPSWTAADIATSADSARSVYVADMDGDGDMDIVSASEGDDAIAWYENDGGANPRGRRPTLPRRPTVHNRCLLPTWTVTVTSTSYQHPQ